jgi:glucose/arabinose dehydrogenase
VKHFGNDEEAALLIRSGKVTAALPFASRRLEAHFLPSPTCAWRVVRQGAYHNSKLIEIYIMKTDRRSNLGRPFLWSVAAFVSLAFAAPLHASFHLMQIEQVIGGVNGDVSAQAVQLRMRFSGENFVSGGTLVAFDASGNNPITLLTFPSDVSNAAAGSRILITTANFASHETSPIASDFTMTTAIPASYLAAGRVAYEHGGILWSVSWGGASYTGSNTGAFTNDDDGNFGPPFAGALPSTSTSALRFNGTASAQSTNNAADYTVTAGTATFTNNAGASTTLGNPTPTPTPSPTPTATPLLPRIGRGPVRIELQPVASGLVAPVDFVSANDGTGRLFIVNQTGQILVLKNGQVLGTAFLDVSSRLVTLMPDYDERGLLGLAFHPGFSDPNSPGFRKLYTYTSEPVAGAADFTVPNPGSFDHQSVIAEWKVSAAKPDMVDSSTRREIMRIDEPEFNHNGGQLVFRPSDHYLYVSLGDGGAANDVGDGHNVTTGNGQDLTTVLGKILRIDPLDPALTSSSGDPVSANGKYRVPVSNPFVKTTQPANRVVEIYAFGLRNPFRFSFDAVTDKLIVGDVGQDHVEEIDVVEAGKNYGWHRKEGTFLFDPATGNVSADPSPDPALTNPVAEYSHDDGIAVLGGYLYRGSGVSALTGKYVFGDLSNGFTAPNGRLFYMDDLNSGTIRELRLGNEERPLGLFVKAFGRDASGEIYLLGGTNIGPSGSSGQVLKIVPAPASPALVNLATRLRVQAGDNVLIGGFILTGSAPKKVILRAIGPSLTANNQPLPGRLSDPTLTLFDGTGNPLDTNDDWMDSPQKQQIIDSTIAPTDPKESAIVATLQPGNYTAIVSGVGGVTGIGVVELYDLDQSAPANPANISTRGFVQTGDNVMIGGFIVGGSQNRTVLARAIGPSLTAAGVPNALQDPMLELHNSSGTTLASNDSWKSDERTQITATGLAPSDDREAAILSAPLAPGNYTAIVRGSGNTTGVALVEIYQLP